MDPFTEKKGMVNLPHRRGFERFFEGEVEHEVAVVRGGLLLWTERGRRRRCGLSCQTVRWSRQRVYNNLVGDRGQIQGEMAERQERAETGQDVGQE